MTRVEVATLKQTDAKLHFRVPGEVEGSRDALLGAPLGGYIERVAVEAGDKVKQHQVLALVDSASHAARSKQAKIELEAAERELKRSQAMADAIPKAELDAAETRVAAAKAAINTHQVNLNYSVINAPFAGKRMFNQFAVVLKCYHQRTNFRKQVERI